MARAKFANVILKNFHYKGGGEGGGVAEGEEEAEADGQDCDAREELLH